MISYIILQVVLSNEMVHKFMLYIGGENSLKRDH